MVANVEYAQTEVRPSAGRRQEWRFPNELEPFRSEVE